VTNLPFLVCIVKAPSATGACLPNIRRRQEPQLDRSLDQPADAALRELIDEDGIGAAQTAALHRTPALRESVPPRN
jgi:hypothetical protein